MHRIELNGDTATAEALARPAVANYGHFTAMQVRDGRVRGLDEHLRRLRDSTRLLFGHDLEPDLVRGHLRHAVADAGAVSVRVNIFSRAPNLTDPATPAEPDVLITTSAPSDPPGTPLRVRSVHYERVLPEVKHVGTFGLFHHIRLAKQAGFDDALFVDALGRISEGSIWNVGFFDNGTVVWPEAPMLSGITLQLLDKGLRRNGIRTETREVRVADLARFGTAFTTNSATVGRPLGSIDDIELPVDPELIELLVDAYETNPWVEI